MLSETHPSLPQQIHRQRSEPLLRAIEIPFHDPAAANETSAPRPPGTLRRTPGACRLDFNPAHLRLARDLRALPADQLARKAGCSLPEIRAYEAGTLEPNQSTLLRLSLVLDMPVEFLGAGPREVLPQVDDAHFRHLRPALAPARRQAIGEIAVLARLLDAAARYVELPPDGITELVASPTATDDVERLAERARSVWGLEEEPVPSVVHALESHGACARKLPKALSAVGSFSMWHRGRPFVVLAPAASSSSRRVDAAHELGHLLMHFEPMPGHPSFERGADRFARAFLLPKEPLLAECPKWLDWAAFERIQARWGVPMPVLIERAFEIGALRESAYLTALSHGDIHHATPGAPRDEPKLIRGVTDLLARDSLLDEVVRAIGLDTASLSRITEG